jgi:hypothetical protein
MIAGDVEGEAGSVPSTPKSVVRCFALAVLPTLSDARSSDVAVLWDAAGLDAWVEAECFLRRSTRSRSMFEEEWKAMRKDAP